VSTNESALDVRLPKGSRKHTELTLGGVAVKVRTDATPATLKQIRDLVDSKFEEFADGLDRGVSAHQLTVLVAFNLAEELLLEKEKLRVLKKRVTETSDRILDRVGAHLNGAEASSNL